jgi:hypothetical protein
MTDIATLGIAIDSRPVTGLHVELNKLTANASNTTATVNALEKAIAKLNAPPALPGSAKAAREAAAAAKALENAALPAALALAKLDQAAASAALRQAQLTQAFGVRTDFGTAARGADIAAYGAELDRVRAKFNPLFAAQQQYKSALGEINQALRTGAISQAEHAAAIQDTKVAFVQQVNSIRGVRDALGEQSGVVNVASKAHSNMSTQAMAAGHAVRSMAEGLAMGIPPSQLLAMQLNHLSYAASNPNGGLSGAFKEVGTSLRGFINPATLTLGSITALTAAAYFAYSGWKNFALQLDDTARIAGTTSSEMEKLQAAASFKGIDTKEFTAGMARFSENVYQAKAGMGGLADVFRANNVQAGDFNSSLEKAADLIQRAAGDTGLQFSILRQVGLPATMEWVRYLQDGAEGVRKAKAEAAAFGGAANDEMIAKAREFDEAWNRTWTNFGREWRSAFVDGIQFFGQVDSAVNSILLKVERLLGGSGRQLPANILKSAMRGVSSGSTLTQSMADDFYNATGAGKNPAGEKPADPNVAREQLMRLQPRIGIIGRLPTVHQVASLQDDDARKSGGDYSPVRTGKDGKSYPAASNDNTDTNHDRNYRRLAA